MTLAEAIYALAGIGLVWQVIDLVRPAREPFGWWRW